MPEINNLELEVKRRRLQRQFIRMVELDEMNDNYSQEVECRDAISTDHTVQIDKILKEMKK